MQPENLIDLHSDRMVFHSSRGRIENTYFSVYPLIPVISILHRSTIDATRVYRYVIKEIRFFSGTINREVKPQAMKYLAVKTVCEFNADMIDCRSPSMVVTPFNET